MERRKAKWVSSALTRRQRQRTHERQHSGDHPTLCCFSEPTSNEQILGAGREAEDKRLDLTLEAAVRCGYERNGDEGAPRGIQLAGAPSNEISVQSEREIEELSRNRPPHPDARGRAIDEPSSAPRGR
jgi:hypothetical protein